MLRKLALVTASVIVVFAYQNCAPGMGDGFLIDQSSLSLNAPNSPDDGALDSTGDVCEDDLLAEFAAGYFPFLKTNCAACHNGEHEAPAFASGNALTSFKVFQDKGYQLVSTNALSTTHNPPFTGPQHTSIIGQLKSAWEAGLEEYKSCKGETTPNPTPSLAVLTTAKTNANMYNNRASANWYALTWNLNTEVQRGRKYPLQFSIEGQVAKIDGSEKGYAFRNPTVKNTSATQKYHVRGMFFYFNGALQEAATTYRSVQAVVCPNQSFNFGTGNALLMVTNRRAATDRFAVIFESIELVTDPKTPCGKVDTGDGGDNTPATVSFAQLISSDRRLGVFRTHCFSCHSGGQVRGGLDLSNYAQAKAKASSIIRRMNDSNSPMPTSGLLSSDLQSIVEKWVQTGTPQN